MALVLVALVVVLAPIAAAGAVVAVAGRDEPRVSDAIVVLGAAQDDGRPRATLAARLDHARALWEDGIAPRIVTSGGKAPGDRFTEAAAGAAYLADRGVPKSDLVAVGQGRDTLSSLEAVARVAQEEGWCTVVLVSDPWHMLRTGLMARDLGLDAVTSPTRTGPAARTPVAVRYVLRESAATGYYLVAERGDVEPVVTGCA